MNKTNGFLVPYKLVPVGPGNDPYPPEARWAEPDIQAAAELMRHVFGDREEALKIAEKAAAVAGSTAWASERRIWASAASLSWVS